MGYSDYGHYKVFDFNKHKCLWSRDITISEGKFMELNPKHLNPDNDQNTYPIPLKTLEI